MIAVVPRYPDLAGRSRGRPIGRPQKAIRSCVGRRPTGRGVRPRERRGTPIYVHAKVCVVDDVLVVGSDNLNRRSWTHDTEISCSVIDEAGAFARDLRIELASEHLGTTQVDALEPREMFGAFADCARRLDNWRADPTGERPPGQLRTYLPPTLSRITRAWSTPLYRTLYDPDGRNLLRRVLHRY